MKCRFVLPEQISGARYSTVPGLPLPPCSISLPPAGELGWGSVLGPTEPQLWYVTRSLRSALFSRCVQSDAVLFPVALSGLVVPIKFSNCIQF